MREQERVAEFMSRHDFNEDPAYQILDLASEVGELASDATKSTNWGSDPDSVDVNRDEIGDVLFSALAVAETLDVDAEAALDEAIDKYQERIRSPSSPYTGNSYVEQ